MAYKDKEKERKNRREYKRRQRAMMSEEEKEAFRAKKREYYKNNKEKCRARAKRYRDKDKEKYSKYRRKQGLKLRYSVTVEWWDKQFEKQKGRCAICGKHQSEFEKALYVDHNHKTGVVRGLLCMDCNFKVGQYENMDIEAIEEYIKNNEKKEDQ